MSYEKNDQEGLMTFLDEAPASAGMKNDQVWRVLIIDDEKDVHSATTFALRNTEVVGRPLEFIHAATAREAKSALINCKDIAVILLDVVMETPNAGLDLVPVIRDELQIRDTRIILRTGQPNQAPEIEVIRDYDINDYKLKSELTQSRLFASLTTAIRSYKQIQTIEAGKKSLSMIVQSSSNLLTKKGLREFAQGVIVHLSGLLSIAPEGLICARRRDQQDPAPQIIAAAGHFEPLIDRPLDELTEDRVKESLAECLHERRNVITEYGIALYIGSKERGDMACFVSGSAEFSEIDENILELFCSNITICADNLDLVSQLSQYAYFDVLTSLPNRNALVEKINQEMRAGKSSYSLCFMDIDNFAELNGSLGQSYGDELLRALASRLKVNFGDACFVARVAGDNFAAFGPSELITVDSIRGVFVDPFVLDEEEQMVSVTAGIVAMSEVEGGAEQAVRDATIILKTAKERKRGEVLQFHRALVDDAQGRLSLLRHLRSAFEANELFLMYQPKVAMANRKVVGFESLVRWKNAKGEFVSPESFIPLAEKSGFIVRLGAWILDKSLESLKKIHAAGWSSCHMAINLSVAQLQHSHVLSMLGDAVAKHGVPAKLINLEITESLAIGDLSATVALLREIKDLGLTLSLDDFGTGYSSLNHLHQLPIDQLKIDRSLVSGSAGNSGKKILEMIVHLAKTLEMDIVAEGVETESEIDFLQSLACGQAQGFYYARPMELEELLNWMPENANG